MTDLILHIGLSKCGSTTIQQSFATAAGYLGRGAQDHKANALSAEFLRLSPRNPTRKPKEADLHAWKEHVLEHGRSEGWQGNFVVSHETLSSPRYGHDPLLAFISTLDEKIWRQGKVKVILVLRKQVSKIPSEYAQNSVVKFNASQAGFERYAMARCAATDLEYHRLVSGLQSRLGAERVLVLFLEEIETREFWTQIRDFTGLENSHLTQEGTVRNIANKKGLSGRTWALSKPCGEMRIKGFANKVLLWTWPNRVLPGLRRRIKKLLQFLFGIVCRTIHTFEFRRDSEISLSTKTEKRIIERFSESNQKLSLLIGRDVSELGY